MLYFNIIYKFKYYLKYKKLQIKKLYISRKKTYLQSFIKYFFLLY
jgi:hypothetical protein